MMVIICTYLFTLVPELEGEWSALSDVEAGLEVVLAHDLGGDIFTGEDELEGIVVGHSLNN